ncbi:MAG: 1-acyl-sn-glycerol-3-phosphate acyltransferase [Gemmatimonadota bacterium]|jgi:1-acyl-sn-glycerol-3-phosphate acyltransferase|nr:1-acyl-sn-glycerol-3-phosphate acyltransferase [Gemmatimonadota bacterium]
MIWSVWAYFCAAVVTFGCGSVVIISSLLGLRGSVYSRATRAWGRGLLRGSGVRLVLHGYDRVDWSAPQVLVANHTGAFEILALAATIPVDYHFVAKKELERIPFFGRAWKAARHISIDRENRQKAVESLRKAAEIIREDGGTVVIFPEGTRSPDGELQPFKKGAFQLAVAAGVPLLPTIVTGSSRILGGGDRRVRPGVMHMYFGEMIPLAADSSSGTDALIERTHTIMREMLAAARAAEQKGPSLS